MTAKQNTCAVSSSELESLQRFSSGCNSALSLYLNLRALRHGESAVETVDRLARQQRQLLGLDDESWNNLQEDLEIIKLHLKTNGRRDAAALAIFSCARDYFWRAYNLSYSVPTHLHIGPQLDTEHLIQACTQEPAEIRQYEHVPA